VSGVRSVLAVHPSFSSASTGSAVSVTDHPLAVLTNASAGPPSGGIDVELSERGAHPLATPHPPSFTAPPPPPPLLTASKVLPAIVSPTLSPSLTLDNLADTFLSGASPRTEKGFEPILHPEPLPAHASDLERLRMLVDRRAWADVILMTERLLRGSSSHYAPIYDSLLRNTAGQALLLTLDSQQADLVWIMTVKCQAWLKMKRYSDLGLEIELWGFCHHNDNTAPSWIPWSLHILAASSLLYTSEDPNSNKPLDTLLALRADIPDDEAIAKLQVEHALSNAFIRRKDWRMALSSQQRMLDVLPVACQQQAQKLLGVETCDPGDSTAPVLEKAYKCEILSRQGRVLLQLGALKEASEVFQMASTTWKETLSVETGQANKDNIVQLIPAQLAVNEGLLCFSYAKHGEALEFFRKAVQQIRQTGSLSQSSASDENWTLLPVTMAIAPVHALYSETINNMAICALYTCRLREALLLMESLVREDPTRFLTERVALNLCTLYELSNETTASSRKKRVLQQIAKRFFLHDISPFSFRL
jgi:tetratricopeptide (TPR) repeat protein